jgi:hypothetical protein
MARTAIEAPTGPDEMFARPGTWAQSEVPDPKISPPRRTYTGIWVGIIMCEARSRRFDWTRQDTSIGRDYIEGEERVLAHILHDGAAENADTRRDDSV